MSEPNQNIAELKDKLAAINSDISTIKSFITDIEVAVDQKTQTQELENLDQQINNI